MARPHHAPKDPAKKELQAEKRAAALDLRRQGYSYEKIGIKLGEVYNNGSPFSAMYCYKMVSAAIKSVYQEKAHELVKLEMERLDAMQLEALSVLQTEHVLVNSGAVVRTLVLDEKGRPVIDSDTGLPKSVPLLDDGPRLQAIDRLLKIQERRARLLGLDKPTKVASTNPNGDKAAPGVVIVASKEDQNI